jgi:hypothetical protein
MMAISFMFRVCLLIELILTLSGCAMFSVMDGVFMVASLGALPQYTKSSPKVLCANEDSIGVGYYFWVNSDNEASQLNESLQLISEHCAGEYIEAKQVNRGGNWRGIYAICLQADGSPSVSQPCEYDTANENVGFGKTDPTIPDG